MYDKNQNFTVEKLIKTYCFFMSKATAFNPFRFIVLKKF